MKDDPSAHHVHCNEGMRPRVWWPAILISVSTVAPAADSSKKAEQIVQRSVANTRADWASAPQYDFTEHDFIDKDGSKTIDTYQVLMIDGSPYAKMIERNGKRLSKVEAAEEDRKLRDEIADRSAESPSERRKRIDAYLKQRRQDHALLLEMVKAFRYDLTGEETVNGHLCYVLSATPKPDYVPPSRETRVLKGMRGTLWIDTEQYQWVKVKAEVFRPVSFGLFIAKVQPGTQFLLEQQPVSGSLWLPSYFSMRVNAKILFFAHDTIDNENYWGYRRADTLTAEAR